MSGRQLLSSLRHRWAALGPEAFAAAERHPWLLWEPGEWRPPGKPAQPPVPGGEALVFPLVAGERALVLGRDPGNQLALADASLSPRHLALRHRAGAWLVEDLDSANGTRLDGARLEPFAPAPVARGAHLEAGQVTLTFCTAEELWPRLSTR